MARSISFDILAGDKASKVLEEVGREVTQLERKIDGAGGDIDVDTTKAREQIAAVDAQLARLNAKSLKVDADTAVARRDLQILEAEAKQATGDRKLKVDADIEVAKAKLRSLDGAKVAVDVETAAAQAKLAAIEASMKKIDGDKLKVPVDVDAAAGLGKLAEIGAQLRNIKTPVLIPVGIAGGLEVLSWIQSVAGGLASLGSAFGVGAGVTVAALSGVSDAVTELGEKTETTDTKVSSSSSSIRSAIRGVESAQRDLRDANEAVERSEEDLQQAQVDAYDAVKALDQARKDATRTLEDYALRSADMSLRQEAADLSVARAQERLAEVNRDSKATALDRAEAELAVREALQRQNELAVDATRLSEDKAVADAKGVEQSDQVVSAQDRVADANKRVEEAQRGIEKAHEQVALAAQRVSDAQAAVREASQAAGAAGAKAADDQREAFGKLTPEGQRFAQFLRDVVDGPLRDLQDTAQAGVLPGLQQGIAGFFSELDGAGEVVDRIAGRVGDFFSEIGPAAGRAADAVLRLADIGSEATFGDLAGGISDLLDRFADWANSQDAADIRADIREVERTLHDLKTTGTETLDGLQLAWAAMTFPVDIIRHPVRALLDLYDAVKAVAEHIPGMKNLLPDLSGEFDRLDAATSRTDGSTRALDGSSRNLASAQRDLESATRQAKDEFLRGEEASIRYEASVNRAEDAVKRNGATLNEHTAKGRDNKQTLIDMAQAANGVITSMDNSNAPLDQVRAKYDTQRESLIRVATQMGLTRTQAQQYIDKLLQVPATRTTTITVNKAQAEADLQSLQNRLAALNGALTVTPKTGTQGQGAGVLRLSTGGWVVGPGPSGVDSVNLLAAPDEFVVRSGQAARYGPLLQAINSGASPAQLAPALAPFAGVAGTVATSGSIGGSTVVNQYFNLSGVLGTNDEFARKVATAAREGIERGYLPRSLLTGA